MVLALLPLVARDLLAGDSLTFGLLLGAFGVGAVVGGLTSARVSEKLSNEQIVRLALATFALGSTLCALSSYTIVSMGCVLLCGWAWVMSLALFNTSVQLSTPRWVVGRAMAMYQMSTFGGMALGAWLWGLVAEAHSVAVALQGAPGAMLIAMLFGFRWPLPKRTELNLDPLDRWEEPPTALGIVPRSGPVAVSVLYLIAEEDVQEFMTLMYERRRIRRRDGASAWTLLRDLESVDRWVERFEVPTWAAYVRFHARTTQEDGKIGERLRELHRGKQPPRVRRMLIRDPGQY